MPVIGKLDQQVNDILIAPLADPNAPTRETHREDSAQQSEKARPRELSTNKTTDAEKMAAAQASLPIWLL